MRAAGPAAGAAHSFFQLLYGPPNVLLARLHFLDGDNPADPFIACQGRNILPRGKRRLVGSKHLPQIFWHTMHYTARNSFAHTLAADQGLEPQYSPPEGDVLPLDESARLKKNTSVIPKGQSKVERSIYNEALW